MVRNQSQHHSRSLYYWFKSLFFRVAQLPPLRAMENPADYDIDKDMGNEEVDEAKIGIV